MISAVWCRWIVWPRARIAGGGKQAATVVEIVQENKQRARGNTLDHEKLDRQSHELKALYDEVSSALYYTSRAWDEGVVGPRRTHDLLVELIDTLLLQ